MGGSAVSEEKVSVDLAGRELAGRYAAVRRAGGRLPPAVYFTNRKGATVPLTIHDLAKVLAAKHAGAGAVDAVILDVTNDGSKEARAKLERLHAGIFRISEEALEQAERGLRLRLYSGGRSQFRR